MILRRRTKFFLFLVVIILFAILKVIYDGNVFPVMRLENYTWTENDKIDAFNRKYPTHDEICSYLNDKTILVSKQYQSEIWYFGKDKIFKLWFANEIQNGQWTLTHKIQPLEYRGHWRFPAVEMFCLVGLPDLTIDNCVTIFDVNYIIASPKFKQTLEGDPIGLSQWRRPPFTLPATLTDIHALVSRVNQTLNKAD